MIQVKAVEKVKEYYIDREALFGLIRWEKVLRVDSIGNELRIFTDKIPEKVFLNGKEYKIV